MNFHTKMLLNLIFPIIQKLCQQVKVNRGIIQNKSVHVPIAVGAITVCRPKKEFGSPPMIYMGADCIEVLLEFIQSEVSRVSNILKNVYVPCIMRPEDQYMHKHAKHCFMCHKKFSDFCHLDKVRDHCHCEESSGTHYVPLVF